MLLRVKTDVLKIVVTDGVEISAEIVDRVLKNRSVDDVLKWQESR